MTTLAPSRQLVLPGQTAAPDGPVDLTIMFAVHWAFRRDLDAFVAAAPATPVDDRGTWQALARRWELFSTVLHHHHSGEDAGLWPLLAERAAPEERATLEAMAAEHHDIDPLLEACAAGFARLAAAADDDARAALCVRLAAAREHLARHLRHEETEALVLVQRHLSAEDWRRMEEEHFTSKHSLRQTLELVGWLLHGLPHEAVQRLRTQPGGNVLLVLYRLVVRRGAARRERRAFRYA